MFMFKVIKTHKTALERQIHEAVRIASHGVLNARCEFRQNQLKRLSVSLTARELKAEERQAERLDQEMALATKILADKIDANKVIVSNCVSLNAEPADPFFMQDSDLFMSFSVKRPIMDPPDSYDQFSGNRSAKKAKLSDYYPVIPTTASVEMGRRSKGNTQNETKNLDFSDKPAPPLSRPKLRN